MLFTKFITPNFIIFGRKKKRVQTVLWYTS